MTTITEVSFDIYLTYSGLEEAAFDADQNAQTGTIIVLASSMSNIEAEDITIVNETNRRLVALGTTTTVVYQVTAVLELLGFRSIETMAAFESLGEEVTSAVSAGRIVKELRKSGNPVYNTPLFDADNFTISSFRVSGPRTKFIQTAAPTFSPTQGPTVFFELITEQETYLSLVVVGLVLCSFAFFFVIWMMYYRSQNTAQKKYGVPSDTAPTTEVIAESIPDTVSAVPSIEKSATILPESSPHRHDDKSELIPFGRQETSVYDGSYDVDKDTNDQISEDGSGLNGGRSLQSVHTRRVILPPISVSVQRKRGPGHSDIYSPSSLIGKGHERPDMTEYADGAGESTFRIRQEDSFILEPPTFEKRMVPGGEASSNRLVRSSRRHPRRSAKIVPTVSNSSERAESLSELEKTVGATHVGSKRRKHGGRRLPGPGEATAHDSDSDNIPTVLLSPHKKGMGPGFGGS